MEYRACQDSGNEKALDDRLALLAKLTYLKETSAESAFSAFSHETWGYAQTSQRGSRDRNWSRGSPVVSQIMALARKRAALDGEIARQGREVNALVLRS